MPTEYPHLDVRSVPIVTSTPSTPALSQGRLVVVISRTVDEAPLAGRILEAAGGREVLLVGIGVSFIQEADVRRSLALVAAFIRNAVTQVTIRMEAGPDWMPRLRARLAEDDQLACLLEMDTRAAGSPMHDVLSAALHRPVYVFTGAEAWDEGAKSIARRLSPWLASVVVILGFLGLQIALSRSADTAATTLLLLLTLPMEAGSIWLCNALLA